MLSTRHLKTDEGALERDERAAVIDIVAAFGNPLFGSLFSPIRAFEIDLVSSLGGLREYAHLIRENLDETPRHGQEEPGLAFAVPDLADFHFGEQRCVAGKNAEITFGARNLNFFNLFVNNRSLRRNDNEIDAAFRHRSPYFTSAIF
jgi:hypothetical protein